MPRLFVFIVAILCCAFTGEWSTPWTKTDRAIVLDIYQGNTVDWDKLADDTTITAIIHKASDGLRADTAYAANKAQARKHGYLWGAFHLGRPGDPDAQAQFFLNTVWASDSDSVQLALDLEGLDSSMFMSLHNARIFVQHVQRRTGRYPLLYLNNEVLRYLGEHEANDTVLKKCPLWYARYKNTVSDFDTTLWKSYTLWQFSCELNCRKTGECLYNAPGCDRFVDVDIYNGTRTELRALWPVGLAKPGN